MTVDNTPLHIAQKGGSIKRQNVKRTRYLAAKEGQIISASFPSMALFQ